MQCCIQPTQPCVPWVVGLWQHRPTHCNRLSLGFGMRGLIIAAMKFQLCRENYAAKPTHCPNSRHNQITKLLD